MKSNIYNKHWRLNHLYKIVDKKWATITFKFNKAQEELHQKQIETNRLIILKARQLWISTYKLIEWLDRSIFKKNQTCIITAHKLDKLKDLFAKVKFAYDNLPESIQLKDWKIWKKPQAFYNSANELYFKENNSKIQVSLDSRSWTPTFLHITELAFMDRAKEMWTWSIPSIPKWAPITIETTANGIWNFFEELWSKYYKRDWEFSTVFFPWYEQQEYRSDNIQELPKELEHLKNYNLEQQQISWYIEQYNLLWREVFQEYPTHPQEAFLNTWNPFFNIGVVNTIKPIPYTQDLKYTHLRIYWKPNNNCLYGVDTSWGGVDWDNASIVVRDTSLNLLACFYDRVPPDYLADVVLYLWDLWYKAINTLAVEINNTWIATIDKLKTSQVWPYLYWQTTVDERTQRKSKKLWFNTNIKTRPLILNSYEELIRKKELIEFDERVKDELFTFIINDNWKPEAMQWKHDDWIMSDAICCRMINTKQTMWLW